MHVLVSMSANSKPVQLGSQYFVESVAKYPIGQSLTHVLEILSAK